MNSLQCRIRNIDITPALVLSPMSGVTNVAFRRLIREFNPGCIGLVVSEFVSVEAMTRQVQRSFQMMRFYEEERPVAIQIFGYDPVRMRDAAMMVQDSGADIVDINCGCPAPKVVRKGGGCELMRQPQHLAEILRGVRKAVTIPLTIKIRSGWDADSINAFEVARIAEAEGVEAVAIHGRTRSALYHGRADWEIVRKLVETLKIPVLGSGDVVDFSSADERLSSGVKGLLIGRAALSNPLVFSEIIHRRSFDLKKNEAMQIRILRRFAELVSADFAPRHCTGRIKQLASQMCRGRMWARQIMQAATFDDQLAILSRAGEALEDPAVGQYFSGESSGELDAAS